MFRNVQIAICCARNDILDKNGLIRDQKGKSSQKKCFVSEVLASRELVREICAPLLDLSLIQKHVKFTFRDLSISGAHLMSL